MQFEELISQTIDETKDLPESMSETGQIRMSHKGVSTDISMLNVGADKWCRNHAEDRRVVPIAN